MVTINGKELDVPEGATVAAALLQGNAFSRASVGGEPRQPVCGMGICSSVEPVSTGGCIAHVQSCAAQACRYRRNERSL